MEVYECRRRELEYDNMTARGWMDGWIHDGYMAASAPFMLCHFWTKSDFRSSRKIRFASCYNLPKNAATVVESITMASRRDPSFTPFSMECWSFFRVRAHIYTLTVFSCTFERDHHEDEGRLEASRGWLLVYSKTRPPSQVCGILHTPQLAATRIPQNQRLCCVQWRTHVGL